MRIVSIILLAVGLAVGSTLAAASPREELAQKIEQLKANPSDNTLREAIIKLAQGITPPPAVPEAAREKFVEGNTIAKSAKGPSGQKLAIKRYQDALLIAPWWGDAYYNLGMTQELAGQFDAAKDSLKLYILTNPGEKEARDAQDRVYALNAKAALARAEKADAAAPKKTADKPVAPPPPNPEQEKAALLAQLNGAIYRHRLENSGQVIRDYTLQINGGEVINVRMAPFSGEPTETYRCTLSGLGCELFRFNGGYVVIEVQVNQVIEKDYWTNGSLADTFIYVRQN